ncbi:MAG: D-aminoacylase, partial [Chthoniobacterales bacterium]
MQALVRLAGRLSLALVIAASLSSARGDKKNLDFLIKGGTVFDGTGSEGRTADVGIRGDRIVAVGKLTPSETTKIIDAHGFAVAPGFINMLSWSTDSLIADGHSQSEIRQGVTTEIMGEGESMGPVNDRV